MTRSRASDPAKTTLARRVPETLLVDRARAGDRDAFDRLAVTLLPRLLGTARRLCGSGGESVDAASVEETVAEALVLAYRGLARFRGECAFGTWVHRIVVRVALDRWRTRARERARRRDVSLARDVAYAPAARGGVEREEEARRVRRAVDALPERQRLVVVLHVWEALDLKEVARLLGVRYATAKSTLHHAREALRRRFAAEGFDGATAP